MSAAYDQSQIRVLKGLEAVRLRPGMYIGGRDSKALHHLIWEIVDNSVDEAMAGHARRIRVTRFLDGSIEVADDGRGIPVDLHATEKISAATVALTVLHAGGKFGSDGAYKQAGGLHGVGASVVNALSSRLDLTIDRDGARWQQTFTCGTYRKAIQKIGASSTHGTTIRFWPDATIFETTTFDSAIIRTHLQNTAYLNPGLTLEYHDERPDAEPEITIFQSASFGEILDPLAADAGKPISDRIDGQRIVPTEKNGMTEEIAVFLALRWYDADRYVFSGFANGIATPWGGTHEAGFRSALLRAMNVYGTKNGLLKEPLTAEDVREGLFAAIAVRLRDPSFEGQTKEKLLNSEVSGAVNTVVYQTLSTFFEEHPSQTKAIVQRALQAAKARLAAKAAREKVTRKTVFSVGTLPGKLTDCSSNDPAISELFLVEGDSAGGSAKDGRDPKTQAILALRGKILNTQKSEDHTALKSEQIDNIIRALGCGVGKHFDISKLRYHKIIFMTDADVDGAHISTLLLTLFHAHMPELIRRGHVYMAMPPLYRVKKGKQSFYIRDDAALIAFLAKNGNGGEDQNNGWIVQRFKGLGEMNADQLAETTMDITTRTLERIVYDPDPASINAVFEKLMGKEVLPRRIFIEQNARFADVDL